MKDYKCISINNTAEENEQIFNSIKIGEKFYIITTNKQGTGLYKYLCIKTELIDSKNSFLHKYPICCNNISCYMCQSFKCLGGKPIKIDEHETMD